MLCVSNHDLCFYKVFFITMATVAKVTASKYFSCNQGPKAYFHARFHWPQIVNTRDKIMSYFFGCIRLLIILYKVSHYTWDVWERCKGNIEHLLSWKPTFCHSNQKHGLIITIRAQMSVTIRNKLHFVFHQCCSPQLAWSPCVLA